MGGGQRKEVVHVTRMSEATVAAEIVRLREVVMAKADENEHSTSVAGSQYRCGRVGRGIQHPTSPQAPPPTPLPHTGTHKHSMKQLRYHKRIFNLSVMDGQTNGPMDQRTNSKPLLELRVRTKKQRRHKLQL